MIKIGIGVAERSGPRLLGRGLEATLVYTVSSWPVGPFVNKVEEEVERKEESCLTGDHQTWGTLDTIIRTNIRVILEILSASVP